MNKLELLEKILEITPKGKTFTIKYDPPTPIGTFMDFLKYNIVFYNTEFLKTKIDSYRDSRDAHLIVFLDLLHIKRWMDRRMEEKGLKWDKNQLEKMKIGE